LCTPATIAKSTMMRGVDLKGWGSMKVLVWVSRIVAAGMICLIGSSGVASVRVLPLEGHRSLLRATITLVDGTVQVVALQGVGCTESICSRVRARDVDAGNVWFDGLTSIHEISHNATGPITAMFRFRDGSECRASVIAGNRVLYVRGVFSRTEKLDLARLTKIDFE
jgi:hypothetical protein